MTNFNKLFFNLIRQSDSPEEIKRSTDACTWFVENMTTMRRVSSPVELELYGYIYSYWSDHKKAPSLTILKEITEKKSSTPGVTEQFNQFEESEEDLKIYSVEDLPEILNNKIQEFESERLDDILKVVRTINKGKFVTPKTKETLTGPNDAIKYFFKEMEHGGTRGNGQQSSGSLNEDAGDIEEVYLKSKADHLAGRLRLFTKIRGIDEHLTIKRGDFVGVLGYTGQRKSTLCRSFCYNAALQGFNALHVTLEQSYEEEMTIYALMHSAHPKFGRKTAVSKRLFDEGCLSDEEEKFLFKTVLPDLHNLRGKLIIRQPEESSTWGAIKTIAEITNQTTPLDLFFLDYLALCETKSRNIKEEIESNIKDMKQFALHFNNNKGIVALTPVQGNRDGWEEAGDAQGKWEATGVYMYSEFERSLDSLLSVYIGPDVPENQLVISSAKLRRSGGIPPFYAGVSSDVGLVTNLVSINTEDKEIRDDLIGKAF